MMVKRRTILIPDDLDQKIRLKQAKLMESTDQSVSFSEVAVQLLKMGLSNEGISTD